MGTFNLCGSLLGPLLVYRFRRRLLMLISLGICALSLFGMSFSLFFMMRTEESQLQYVSIVFILLFIVGFQLGLGPIPYFIGSGLYGGGGFISVVASFHVHLVYLQSFSRMLRVLLLCLWAVCVRGLAISLSQCAFLYCKSAGARSPSCLASSCASCAFHWSGATFQRHEDDNPRMLSTIWQMACGPSVNSRSITIYQSVSYIYSFRHFYVNIFICMYRIVTKLTQAGML